MKYYRSVTVVRIIILLAFLSPVARAQSRTGLAADKVEKIEQAISTEMSRHNIPGISVAVVSDNRISYVAGFGFADLENHVPAKAGTVYRLGSISKPVTAIAVMQLAERGKLDLDAPVQKYCKAFPEKQWPVTTRQLLAHLGGVRHYNSEAEFASTRHYKSVSEGLDLFKNDPLLQEPGTKYTYTTHGYSVLGCAIEGASGISFMDYLRENIFKPAGINRMRADDVFDVIANRAQGYQKSQNGELRNSALADTSYKLPGGGLVSTVEDLAKFAIAFQSFTLVKKETAEQIWTRQKTRDGKEVPYGLGFRPDMRNGMREVHHGGAQQRVSTFLYMIPEKKVAVVLMTNLEGLGGALTGLARQIADVALQNP